MDLARIFQDARALIEDPEHWCQDDYAQNDLGIAVNPHSLSAYCFCTYGAVVKVGGFSSANVDDLVTRVPEVVLDALVEAAGQLVPNTGMGFTLVAAINDCEIEVPGLTAHQASLRILEIAAREAA